MGDEEQVTSILLKPYIKVKTGPELYIVVKPQYMHTLYELHIVRNTIKFSKNQATRFIQQINSNIFSISKKIGMVGIYKCKISHVYLMVLHSFTHNY